MESLLYSEKTHAFELVGKQKFKRQSSAEKKNKTVSDSVTPESLQQFQQRLVCVTTLVFN